MRQMSFPFFRNFYRKRRSLPGHQEEALIIDCWNCLISRKMYDEVTLKELIEEQKSKRKAVGGDVYFDSGEGYFTVFKHTCRRENASSGSSGTLWAEQPFVLGIDADELYKGEMPGRNCSRSGNHRRLV